MFTSYNWGAVPVGASTKQRENQCSNKSAAITIQDVVISHLLGRWGSWRTLRHFWVRLGEEDTIEFQCWQFNFFCCQRHKHWWKGARTRRLGGERPRPHLMLLLLLLAFRWQQDNGKNTLGYPAYKIKQTMTRQELGRETACEDEENWPRKVRKSGELRGSGACLQLPERKCKSTAGAATMCAPHNDTWAERQEGAKTQPSAPPSNIKAIFSPHPRTHTHRHCRKGEKAEQGHALLTKISLQMSTYCGRCWHSPDFESESESQSKSESLPPPQRHRHGRLHRNELDFPLKESNITHKKNHIMSRNGRKLYKNIF